MVSPQVEQYENNLNECLWLSIFWGGMASGGKHICCIGSLTLRRSVFHHLSYIKGWQCGGWDGLFFIL